MTDRIHVSMGFCAFCCILGWYDMKLFGWFLLCLSGHELGHVAALMIYRIPIRSFHIQFAGAVIRHGLCTYGREFVCAAAGPLANGILFVCTYQFFPELAFLSCLMGMANLLPIFPLDGGRMLRSLLLMRMEEVNAMRVMHWVTFAICCLLMVAACCLTMAVKVGIWPIFAALVVLCRVGSANQSCE